MPRRNTKLSRLATAAGFTPTSLAAITGIDYSTLSRHWNDSTWASRMQGQNVIKLAACVPRLADALVDNAMEARLDAARVDIESAGLKLDDDAVADATAGGVVKQFLCTGIAAAGKLLIGDAGTAEKLLRSCWGREQTRALDVAFGTHQRWHALEDSVPLIDASRRAFEALSEAPKLTQQECIAIGHLTHHVGKATGEIIARPPSGRGLNTEWLAGHYVRGSYMGKLRPRARRPQSPMTTTTSCRSGIARTQLRSGPSRHGREISCREAASRCPEEVRLRHTATEILHELDSYNPVYVYYLARTFIPLALEEMDSTFDNRRDQLAQALRRRAEASDNPTIAAQLSQTSQLAGEENP